MAYVCSTYCETTRIAISGIERRSSSAARSPSSRKFGGSRMSTIAMSGRSRRAAWTSASPSATASTTSNPLSREQARQPVAQQGEILGDQDAHGSSARTVVGPPGGLVTVSRPSSASTRRRRPARPEPAGSAPPRPSSTTSSTSESPTARDASRRSATHRRAWRRWSGSRRRRSTPRSRRAPPDAPGCRRRRRPGSRCGARAPRSPPRARGRVSTGGWIPRARSRSSRSASSTPSRASSTSAARLVRVGTQLLLRHAEVHPERDEPRLRAVVQVALDPPELRLLLVDGGRARRLEHADPLLERAAVDAAAHDEGAVDEEERRERDDRPHGPEVPVPREEPDGDLREHERREEPGLDRQRLRRQDRGPEVGAFLDEHDPGVDGERDREPEHRPHRPERAAAGECPDQRHERDEHTDGARVRPEAAPAEDAQPARVVRHVVGALEEPLRDRTPRAGERANDVRREHEPGEPERQYEHRFLQRVDPPGLGVRSTGR